MKRNINFYLEEFKPKPDPLSLNNALSVWLVVFTIMAGMSYWITEKAKTTDKLYQELNLSIKQKESLVNEFENALNTRAPDPYLENSIQNLIREISGKNQIKELIQGRQQQQSQTGFSLLMSDLANMYQPGLWLEKITYTEQTIKLAGAANQVAKIPNWLQKLSHSKYFSGLEFKDLTMTASQNGLYTHFAIANQNTEDTVVSEQP
ncbi:PilN domain-containing protein [Catenovulum sediminis]|uniref:PilN domain-containing protein n=1 Tax=Catenovulum sediminis TaxID=1740262 RepID=A0ABV1RD52_9ALTE|nr:PilN domain-containing protein [Catenovulum sediminis]